MEIQNVKTWLDAHKLTLNEEKNEYMLIRLIYHPLWMRTPDNGSSSSALKKKKSDLKTAYDYTVEYDYSKYYNKICLLLAILIK